MKKLIIGLVAIGSFSNSFAGDSLKECLLLNSIEVQAESWGSYKRFDRKQKNVLKIKGYSIVDVKGEKNRHMRKREKAIRRYNKQNLLVISRDSAKHLYSDISCGSTEMGCTNNSNHLVLKNSAAGDLKLFSFGPVYTQSRSVVLHESNQEILNRIEALKEEILATAETLSAVNKLEESIQRLNSQYDSDLDVIKPSITWRDKIVNLIPKCDEIN